MPSGRQPNNVIRGTNPAEANLPLGTSRTPHAGIGTIGDELLCGDVSNTNGTWLARQLEKLGIRTEIIATLPDDRPAISRFVRWGHHRFDLVFVTGGLGGTPDDATRDAIADAFRVRRTLDQRLVNELAQLGGHAAVFAEEWSLLPEGSRPIAGAPGGAPAFVLGNVYALPGVPSEMRVAFRSLLPELQTGRPRDTWRETLITTEDHLIALLVELERLFPGVAVGSYPTYGPNGAQVELVLRSSRLTALTEAAAHVGRALKEKGIKSRPKRRPTQRPRLADQSIASRG